VNSAEPPTALHTLRRALLTALGLAAISSGPVPSRWARSRVAPLAEQLTYGLLEASWRQGGQVEVGRDMGPGRNPMAYLYLRWGESRRVRQRSEQEERRCRDACLVGQQRGSESRLPTDSKNPSLSLGANAAVQRTMLAG
jgi:hypothetical protein